MALNALAAWVLPQALGGVGGTALLLDLDFSFSPARLHQLVLARVPPGQDARQAAEAALKRVAVARCVDELEAFAALEVLKYDLNHPTSFAAAAAASSGGVGPVLVVIDSLGPLLYERKAAEACKQPGSCFDYMLARAVGRLAAARAASVVACKPALLAGKRLTLSSASGEDQQQGTGGGFPTLEHREYLPGQWAKLATHRLTLLRDAPGETAYFTARLKALVPGGLVGAGPGADQFGAYWFCVGEGGVHVLPPEPGVAEGEVQGGWE